MSVMLCQFCRDHIKEGKYLKTASLICHSSCFRCTECKEVIGSSYSKAPETGLYYHPACLSKTNEDKAIKLGHVCKSCSKACHVGKYVTLPNGERYHSGCFKCQECDQLIEGQYIPYGSSKVLLHPECARKRDKADALSRGRICKACGKPCFEGRIMTVSESELYHAQCFQCTGCRKPITAKFAQYGDDRLPYHMDCIPGVGTDSSSAPSSGNRISSKTKPSVRPNAKGPTNGTAVPAESKPRLCKRCNQECSAGQFYHTSDGAIYHADCFRCSDPSCNQLITGPYAMHGEPPQPYHPACGKELFAPRCCLCCTAIEGQFYRHPFFDTEQYCLGHESRRTCFACGRREPLPESRREGFVDLLDGRALCGQCSSTIIVDADEAVALYRSIVEFMGGALGLTIPAEMRDVPILLVDVPTLNTNRDRLGEVLGHHGIEDPGAVTDLGAHGRQPDRASAKEGQVTTLRPETVIRGITLSKCSEVRHYTSTRLSADGGRGSLCPAQLPQVYKVTQTRDVTAVLVLYGLPRDLTASILAHEAMHVWLKLHRGFPFRMPPKLEEGLCQVIAYLYLESLEKASQLGVAGATASNKAQRQASLKVQSPRPNSVTNSSRRPSSAGGRGLKTTPTEGSKLPTIASKRPKTLLAWFRQQIVIDNSPIYGDGFKEAHAAVSAMGLKATLAHIQRHRALPTVPKGVAARLPPVK